MQLEVQACVSRGYTSNLVMANLDRSQPSEMNAEESHATKGLLRLTMACNEKCPFCNVPAEDYSTLSPPMDEVLNELQTFIDRGDQTLTISGGEPTLSRARLLTLVKTANEGGIRFIEVQTNATLINPKYAAELASRGVTSAFVSLLGHTADLHDHLAGLNGAFDKCLAGIDALLDAGIRVALNPVTAVTTQDHLDDYVAFVAARFPRIRSISLSAVQPHGRGANNVELMPDYSRLHASVQRAQAVAEANRIELLNPYCGLPLCVGWEENLGNSVEAIESLAPHNPQGVDNHGNKRHGPACIDCGLRSRCGGAWHAYWDLRSGTGIEAPWEVSAPWDPEQAGQEVIDARGVSICDRLKATIKPQMPVRWVWVDGLETRDLASIRTAGVTHIGIDIDLGSVKAALKGLRRLQQTNQLVSPQRRIQIYGRIVSNLDSLNVTQIHDLLQLFRALDMTRMYATHPGKHSGQIARANP